MSASPHETPRRLLHVFPGFGVGGAQVRFCTIAARLGPGWRHDILAMDGDLSCRSRLAPEVAADFPQVTVRKGATLANLWRFAAALRRWRPDRLVTYNWGSIEWAAANALVGLPHIHVEDGFGPEERAQQLRRRVLARRLLLRRATVVLPSRTLWRIATEQWRLDPARVRHVPNGILLPRCAGEAAARPVPVVGTVAALRPEKNLSRLLRAFALLRRDRPARLVIVGDGPERPALQALAGALGLAGDVVFAGHLAAPQAAYAGFDLFALSSDTEQMPLSVLEAMAAGLAVAATDVGDVRLMLAADNGPFVVAADDAALAAALAALLDQPGRRAAIGAANRARAAAAYDEATMVQAYAALFEAAG
jgi:glycosyltransferase involved in cell wall biosynthesis